MLPLLIGLRTSDFRLPTSDFRLPTSEAFRFWSVSERSDAGLSSVVCQRRRSRASLKRGGAERLRLLHPVVYVLHEVHADVVNPVEYVAEGVLGEDEVNE